MVFDQPFFGPAPESLQSVNIDFAGREMLAVIHLQVPVSAEHQAVVAFELVGVDDTSSANLLDGKIQQNLGRDIRDDADLDNALSLQDAEDGNLAGGPTAPLTFSSPAKVGLIQFYLSRQEKIGIGGMSQDGHPDGVHSTVNGPVRQLHLLSHLPDGDFQFKELEDR